MIPLNRSDSQILPQPIESRLDRIEILLTKAPVAMSSWNYTVFGLDTFKRDPFAPYYSRLLDDFANVISIAGSWKSPGHAATAVGTEMPEVLEQGKTYSIPSHERNFRMYVARLGFTNKPATLEVIANEHGLTRERVRQILAKHRKEVYVSFFGSDSGDAPILQGVTELLHYMHSLLAFKDSQPDKSNTPFEILTPMSVRLIASRLQDIGAIKSPRELIIICEWYDELLGSALNFWEDYDGRNSVVGDTLKEGEIISCIFEGHWFGALFFGAGFSVKHAGAKQQVRDLLADWRLLVATLKLPLPEQDPRVAPLIYMVKFRGAVEVKDAALRGEILNFLTSEGLEAIQVSSWLIRNDHQRNTLRDGIGRLLTLLGPLSIGDIVDALASTKPGRARFAISITPEDLASVLNATNWCKATGDKWQWNGLPVPIGQKDAAVYQALRALPAVFFYVEAVKAIEGICSIANLSFFLSGPYGFSPKHNMYCLRGAQYNAFDLARSLAPGSNAHSRAISFFVSHDPDVMHIEAPDNWNSQVSVGQFYNGDWTIAHGQDKRPGKAARGILFSGVLPMLKKKDIGMCFDLNIDTETRVIRISRCASNARHAARGDRDLKRSAKEPLASTSSWAVASSPLNPPPLNLRASPRVNAVASIPIAKPKSNAPSGPWLPTGPLLKPSAQKLLQVAPKERLKVASLARPITKRAAKPATKPSSKPSGQSQYKQTVKPVAKSAPKGKRDVYVPVRAQIPPIKQNGVTRPVPKPPAKIAAKDTSRNTFAKLSAQEQTRQKPPNKRP